MNIEQERKEALREIDEMLQECKTDHEENLPGKLEEQLWAALCLFQGEQFYTAKGLEYTYRIRGNEIFVDHKDKSITRASVAVAAQAAVKLQKKGEIVSGPKKLGTFGASYLYPVFIRIGLIMLPEEE